MRLSKYYTQGPGDGNVYTIRKMKGPGLKNWRVTYTGRFFKNGEEFVSDPNGPHYDYYNYADIRTHLYPITKKQLMLLVLNHY